MSWHLQDAKNHLSKVVQRSRTEGPQVITVRGEPAAVVVSAKDYEAIAGKKRSFVDALLDGPQWDDAMVEAVNERPISPHRDAEF